MKFETLMLKSLFSACLLICVLTVGAMLTSRTMVSNAATSQAPVVVAVVAKPAG